MQELKYVLCSLVSGVFSLLFPIKDFMTAMLIVFALNYLFGWIAGMVHGERWSLKKSMVFFYHCTIFFVLAAALFITGHFLHNDGETLGVVKALCGVAIWFYSTNIARNWQNMLVEDTTMWKVAGFVYYVLTLKMVDKIPYLGEYLGKGKELKD
ncbi:MAG: hypothetical protein ACFN4H_07275 [Prevotella sp.]